MARYTVQLRKLISSNYNLGLAAADYPIFDETYRAVLNAKIKAHYYFREIGSEQPGQFKHWLNTKMNEVMPYYNKLYAAEALIINPLYNVNMTENLSRTTAQQSAAANGNESVIDNVQDDVLLNVKSNTPAALLSVADLKTNVYASEAGRQENEITNKNTAVNSATSQAANTSLDEYVKTIAGTSGQSASKMLMEYRKTFLNIDMMIILELGDCFMGVYDI